MGEWLKIALKAALVVVMMVVVWGILSYWQVIPSITIGTEMANGIGLAKAVMMYWYPGFEGFFSLCFATIAIDLAAIYLQFTLNITKWLYQIFE